MKRMNFPGRKNARRQAALQMAEENLQKQVCLSLQTLSQQSKIQRIKATIEATKKKIASNS